jgi:asparagine synthase (glutamine-hydrolysing)
VASSVRANLRDPDVPRTLDRATVATVAAGLWAHAHDTGYEAIKEIPAGHTLSWRPGQPPVVRASWRPPETIALRRRSLDDAAPELRALIEHAVDERLSATGPTAVSLSGGWDSTAVYGAAQSVVRSAPNGRSVHGVSISYPQGDPGREDEFIAEVTAHWNAQPDLIEIGTIPLFVDAESAAGRRDQPFAHAYEHWNRALSRRARAAGAHVILDGVGGDQLFQASDIFLADLFRTGQWVELMRQYRARSGAERSLRDLYRWGVRPALPMGIQRAIARLRGHSVPPHYLERFPSAWFRREFFRAHSIFDRERAARPELPASSFVLAESHAYLRFAFYPRIFSHLQTFAAEEGVEVRSPLLDERVVRFAVSRPWSDRVDGAETKNLLRRAVRGLLPERVLAPRAHRTGTTNAYFLREMRSAGWTIAQRVLPDSRLAALGIIDPVVLREGWEHLLEHDDDELAVRAYFTLQAELWVRARGD